MTLEGTLPARTYSHTTYDKVAFKTQKTAQDKKALACISTVI